MKRCTLFMAKKQDSMKPFGDKYKKSFIKAKSIGVGYKKVIGQL